jgi:HSP20 family protein
MSDNMAMTNKNRQGNYNVEATRNGNYHTPRVDIVENDKELLLYADVPGAKSEHIDLRFENGELVVRARVEPTRVNGHLVLAEYQPGDFHRVFQVHESIDASKIEAEYKNGVLTVHLPKQEAAKPKQVQIRTQA